MLFFDFFTRSFLNNLFWSLNRHIFAATFESVVFAGREAILCCVARLCDIVNFNHD